MDAVNIQQFERRCWGIILVAAPLFVLAISPWIDQYALSLIYLKPPKPSIEWNALLRSNVVWGVFALSILFPMLALLGNRLYLAFFARFNQFPLAAILAFVTVWGISFSLEHPRVRWFFCEWTKVRTENPSFARNKLFWEKRDFETSLSNNDRPVVKLVGSSQVYQGIDLAQLSREASAWNFEKNCMAGMGPQQYLAFLPRILERNPKAVVMYLSAFDLFRDDELSTDRLRWGMTPGGLRLLVQQMEPDELVDNREQVADISFATINPLWRNRDHFRRALFYYWWDFATPKVPTTEQSAVPVLAVSSGLDEAKLSLRNNVRKTKLWDLNRRSLQKIADELRQRGIELIVLEGTLEPSALEVIPSELRQEATAQLRELAELEKFQFVPRTDQPELDASRWADAYHLDEKGRAEFSAFLAAYINQRLNP